MLPVNAGARLRFFFARRRALLLRLRLAFFLAAASLGQVVPSARGSANTATASSPASEESRKQPSRVTLTATGIVPMPCERPTDSVRCTSSLRVSITAIRSWWATAT